MIALFVGIVCLALLGVGYHYLNVYLVAHNHNQMPVEEYLMCIGGLLVTLFVCWIVGHLVLWGIGVKF